MRMAVFTLKQVLCCLFIFALFLCGVAIGMDRHLRNVPTDEVVPVFAENAFTAETAHDLIPLQIEVVKPDKPLADAKRILIYHTHTFEAYEPTKENSYKATSKWRTEDAAYNVVRVGKELAALLTALGLEVVHDTGKYEPPVLSTSYTRSLKMLEARDSAGEKYDLYIDLHRDAYSESMRNTNTVNIAGTPVAKLMMLVGKGSGESFSIKPEWERNYAIAEALTENLNGQKEGLCRRISLKTGRFNQHIAQGCVLIEVGNNMNTLEEALNSLPYLADALYYVLENMQEGEV